MCAAGVFIEHLPGLIGPLRSTRNLGDYFAIQHVNQNETWMAMRLTHLSRCFVNFADRNLPIFHGQIGQVLLKDWTLFGPSRRSLSLCCGLKEQQQRSALECVTSSNHGLYSTEDPLWPVRAAGVLQTISAYYYS